MMKAKNKSLERRGKSRNVCLEVRGELLPDAASLCLGYLSGKTWETSKLQVLCVSNGS